MIPVSFDEANARLGAPDGMSEMQVMTIPAFVGEVKSGSVDGCSLVVVAWQPSAEDLKRLNSGGLIYLSTIGGLPPHFLTTDFQQAINPA